MNEEFVHRLICEKVESAIRSDSELTAQSLVASLPKDMSQAEIYIMKSVAPIIVECIAKAAELGANVAIQIMSEINDQMGIYP